MKPSSTLGVAEAPAPAGLLGDALTAIMNLRMLGDGITSAELAWIEDVQKRLHAAAGVKGAPLVPCPVCGGEAVHAQDLLERTVIQPRDVPPGKWKVDMPDGLYTQMPGDPPGPADLRKIIGGYVYEVQPHSGKLVAAHPPTGFRLQKFNEDMQRRTAGVTTPDRVATPGCKCLGEGKANFNVHATNCPYRTHGVSASDHQTFSQKPPMEDSNAQG